MLSISYTSSVQKTQHTQAGAVFHVSFRLDSCFDPLRPNQVVDPSGVGVGVGGGVSLYGLWQSSY